MRISFLLAGLLAFAVPAAPAVAAQKDEAPNIDAVQADLAAYGAWLNQAMVTDRPVQEALTSFGDRWQATFARGVNPAAVAEMRREIAALVAVVDRSYAELEALPIPTISTLPLDADLLPSALMRDLKAVNRQVRALVESFGPILDGIARNDERATYRALSGTIGGARLLYQTHATMTRASMAVIPRDESIWNMSDVGLLFFRAGGRVLAAWPADSVAGTDRSLAADLRAIAAELEATSAQGEQRLAAEIEADRVELAEAERQRDRPLAAILHTGIRVGEIDSEIFVQGRRLAAILRTGADRFRDGRVTLESLGEFFGLMVPVKERLDAIALEESAALAAGN